MYAVCFPDVSKERFGNKTLPLDANYDLMLFKEDLDKNRIEKCISDIFSVELEGVNCKLGLSRTETKILLENILAPKLNLLPIAELEAEYRNVKFKKMLNEQICLLDYLEEQRTAVISGAAGTGKTLMALEKAKRNADKGERVLFLCYNARLREHLSENYKHNFIDYYTIDALACKLCNTSESDYSMLWEIIFEMFTENKFPYKHIIVDEGQDFGQDHLRSEENIGIIDCIYDGIYNDPTEKSSFYIFYDKNQLIQGKKLPDCIADADCKLTLYRNCRNTENIAITSMRLLGTENTPKLFEKAIKGSPPLIIFEESSERETEALKNMLDCYAEIYGDNVVILTCYTVENSIISKYRDGDFFRHNGRKYIFTTCRKFKGLEADAIILIDLKKEVFMEDNSEYDAFNRRLYVGSSRAKYELCAIINMSDEDIADILEKRKIKKSKNNKKRFANLLNAKLQNIL